MVMDPSGMGDGLYGGVSTLGTLQQSVQQQPLAWKPPVSIGQMPAFQMPQATLNPSVPSGVNSGGAGGGAGASGAGFSSVPGTSPSFMNQVGTSQPSTTTPAAPGTFTATSNLIGSQFNPTPSQTTQTAQNQLSGAQQGLANWQGFTPYQAVGSGDQSGINQQLAQAGQLYGGAGIQSDPRLLNQAQGLVQGAGFTPDTGLLNQAQGLVQGANIQGTGDLLGQAQQQLGQAQLGPLQGQGSDTQAARNQLGSLLGGIGTSAPNRLQIAQDALKTFDQQQNDQNQLGIQDIGREAAASGRLGSGMVSTSLGDLQTQLARARDQEVRGLAGDVAGQTLQDRLNAISGTQGALGQLSGQDLAQQQLGLQAGSTAANLALARSGQLQGLAGQQFGQNQAQANQALAQAQALQGLQGQNFGETAQSAQQRLAQAGALQGLQGQGFQQGAQTAQQQLAQGQALQGLAGQQFGQGQTLNNATRQDQLNRLATQQAQLSGLQGQVGTLAGLQQQGFGQDQANTAQLVNERNYQNQLAQQALQNRLTQFGLEQGAQAQDFGQQQDVNSQLAQLGFGGNTAGVLGGLSDVYGNQGTGLAQGTGDLLSALQQNAGGGGLGGVQGLLNSLPGGGSPDLSGEGAVVDPNSLAALQNAGIQQGVDPYALLGLPQLAGV